ncbi:MAG: iron uptake porin [Leptolyngbyaceae bacterium]|nr:iron uptake porin [Leptolyngbyaceae bacterium]
MSKILWTSYLINPVILGAVLATSLGITGKPSVAAEAEISTPSASSQSLSQVNQYSVEGKGNSASLSQVTSVSQLSDVQPTDWAFQALQSLVERYGVIAGYPDGRFRGNRAMTRYEFAAGLNAALDRVNELIAAGTADLVTKEDLATLQKLQEEFSAELATLRGRVDALEARTATLEAQQFSTTTKLAGEAIFAITDVFSGDNVTPAGGTATATQNTVFANRVRLNLNTSFTGSDLLTTRLQVGNFGSTAAPAGFTIAGGTLEGVQTFNFASGATPGAFILDTLNYSFQLNERTKIVIEANAGDHSDYIPTLNPYLEDFDGGSGSLSAFGQRSPIYRLGSGSGVGAGFSTNLSRSLVLSGGYLANGGGNNPGNTNGLFNGSYSAIGQLTFNATDTLSLGLTYNNAYFTENAPFNYGGAAGTTLANGFAGRTFSDSYGVAASFRFSPQIAINAWGMTTNGRNQTIGDFNVWSYAVGLAFPDLGKKGNTAGVLVGVQPYLTGINQSGSGFARDIPLHVEGFYKYQLNDNISITPGVIWLTAPNQNNNNPDIVIGTLRTTFLF